MRCNRLAWLFPVACGLVLGSGSLRALAQETEEAEVSSIQIVASSDISIEGGEGGEGSAPKIGISFGVPGSTFTFGSGAAGNPTDASALASLMNMEAIRKELKLSDEQIAGIEKLQKRSGELMQKAIQEVINQPREEGGAVRGAFKVDQIREARDEVRQLTDRSIEEILLPEQLSRIREIAFQVEISRLGLGPSLTRGKFGEEVGVRPEQKPELIRLAQRIDEEMKEKIAKIRSDARAELLAALDPEQQEKAKGLIGDYFDYSAPTLDDMAKQMTAQFTKGKNAAKESSKDSGEGSKEEEPKP